MKDAHPRIFRQLEKTGARDGFDMIVNAAVLSYGSLRAPNDTQARDFARLVVPLWSRVTPDTRRTLAAGLSHSSRVPREIVELLIAEPIEVSAPFLMSSPALSDAELKALALSPDRRLRKLIAERRQGPRSADSEAPVSSTAAETPASQRTTAAATSAAPERRDTHSVRGDMTDRHAPQQQAVQDDARDLETQSGDAGEETTRLRDTSPENLRLSESRQGNLDAPPRADGWKTARDITPPASELSARPARRAIERLEAPPLVPDLLPAAPPVEDASIDNSPVARSAAAVVRETLLRLALPGRRKSLDGATAGSAPTLAELVSMAVRQDGARFYDGLVRLLGLSPEMLRKIVLDDTGERLAVALKAVGASHADAMTVLMMMKQTIGLDVEAFDRMTRYYRALKAADCTSLARGHSAARHDAPATAPALRSPYQDTAPPQRTEARPTFGRRTTLPSETASDKRSA